MILLGEELKGQAKGFRETCFGIVPLYDQKILLIKDDDDISLVGGGLESCESKESCLVREFKDELGRDVKNLEHLCTIDCHWKTKTDNVMRSLSNVYIVNLVDGVNKDNYEILEVDLNEALTLDLPPYHKKAIEEYQKQINN